VKNVNVKVVGISGKKSGNILNEKFMNLKRTARTGILDFYRHIIEFKKGYHPRRVICLQTPTLF
jgi:hypothetical protein